MTLVEQITKDMTTAMKEQDKFNLSVLRMLKSALQLEKINLINLKILCMQKICSIFASV